MGFCLLRRDADAVALIASTVFSTRAEALAEISRLSAGDGIDADEVFVVDIDAAMPVLIVAPSSPPEAKPAADEEAVAATEEPIDTTLAPDITATASVLEVEAAIAEAVLAGSEALEADVGEPHAAEEASDEPESPVEDLPIAEDVTTEEPSADAEADAPEPTEVASSSAPQSWPWDVQVPAAEEAEVVVEESVEIEPVPAADVSEVSDEQDVAAEPLSTGTQAASQEAEIVQNEPVTDEEDPHPETEKMPDEVEPEPEPELADSHGSPLPDEVSGLLADLEELVPAVSVASPAKGTATMNSSERASASLDPEPVLPEEPPKAYAAGGSDITELTCEDCIYLNTCPKKDESDPSSCGSFQWKSI
jgi:hypothetical protein